jgi:hypothetical protein
MRVAGSPLPVTLNNQLNRGSGDMLRQFFNAIGDDPRIGLSHISLYCVLYHRAAIQKDGMIAEVIKSEIMKDAKISGLATFHKCIRDLHEYGYIRYLPSYNRLKKSKVFIP